MGLAQRRRPRPIDLEPLVDQAQETLVRGTSSAATQARTYLLERGLDVSSASVRSSHAGVIDEAQRPGYAAYLRTAFLDDLDRRHETPWPAYPTGMPAFEASGR